MNLCTMTNNALVIIKSDIAENQSTSWSRGGRTISQYWAFWLTDLLQPYWLHTGRSKKQQVLLFWGKNQIKIRKNYFQARHEFSSANTENFAQSSRKRDSFVNIIVTSTGALLHFNIWLLQNRKKNLLISWQKCCVSGSSQQGNEKNQDL